MDTANAQAIVLQNVVVPFALQSFLAEVCSKALLAFVQSASLVKGSCGPSIALCMTNSFRHGESRKLDAFQPCMVDSISSDTEEENALEKCTGSILDSSLAPEVKGRICRAYFSEWLLVAKNKDDDEEDEDEEDDEDDVDGEDDDDEGDDEEGDDDEGAEGEGEGGEGDDDDEDDEADDDDDEEDDDEDEDEDEDELPPKKLKK